VLEGVHQEIPDGVPGAQELHMLPRPPAEAESDTAKMLDFSTTGSALTTDADQVLQRYRRLGAAQGHVYGSGSAPNFNVAVPDTPRAAPAKPSAAGPTPPAPAATQPPR
jgi:hypothetical protein